MMLKAATPGEWLQRVLNEFDSFLVDHAACERKASATALTFVSHYPDRPELVSAMIELFPGELDHRGNQLRTIGVMRYEGQRGGRGLALAGGMVHQKAVKLVQHPLQPFTRGCCLQHHRRDLPRDAVRHNWSATQCLVGRLVPTAGGPQWKPKLKFVPLVRGRSVPTR